jgi:aryl-alcohol dehydrogenase (NADP+)
MTVVGVASNFPHRHCERSEAIQRRSADASLDCFAALAMTALAGYGALHQN